MFLYAIQLGVAQPVTIDNESVPVEYYRIPDNPLDPSYTTYSADIEARFGGLSMTGYTATSLEDDYLTLEGYKKVNRGGDIEIEASIGDFNVFGERTDLRRTKKKNKDGKEITYTTYAKEVKYSIPISIKVADKNGNTLEDKYIFSWTDENTYTTSYYNSLSELDSYWRINRTSKLTDLQRDKVREGFKKISSLLNDKYGYRLVKENAHFETIGKKKHPDYDVYQNALETIKEAFKTMSASSGLNTIKARIETSLNFYNAESKKYGTKSKDDKKLKHITLYNQALAYFWLEDFDQAEMFAKEIQKFNAKDKDARRLLADIDYTRSSLERADKKSRHGVMVGGKT
ncbi:MAG: hypothetical protein IPP15_07875 [Saprospiraceae bacterium]|uniref:Uncharacterized protein n=1 Tax=Candidatus Opimibacter skivensis TaxID=2982028 RepID=A0A9D7XMJ4_9BACT|nr:hypothetical protein [Candidatus Opimibacter skivensis]